MVGSHCSPPCCYDKLVQQRKQVQTGEIRTAWPECQPDADETVDASKEDVGPNELEESSNRSRLLPVPPSRGNDLSFPE